MACKLLKWITTSKRKQTYVHRIIFFRNVDEPVISGAPNLDDMLGNLQEDMDKQGVKTKQKGVCAACRYCPVHSSGT